MAFNEKLQGMSESKENKNKVWREKEASEPDSGVICMLELLKQVI